MLPAILEEQARAKAEAHLQALTQGNKELAQQVVQLNARLNYTTATADKHLKKATTLIDQLHNRIDIMVDSWVIDLIKYAPPGPDRTEAIRLAEIFRPQRIGKETVPDGKEGQADNSARAEAGARVQPPDELPR